MEAKRIEVSAPLHACHQKCDVAEILNISRMTVHRVAKCLENSESLQDCPWSGKPQVSKCETVKKPSKMIQP